MWGEGFRASIGAELESARGAGFAYVEVGGWALDPAVRGTSEALKSVLATYALAQLQGGAIGVSTATERNGSARILRRLGGRPLEWAGSEIPPYFDENYGCAMEILRFDSRYPTPRYIPMILRAEIGPYAASDCAAGRRVEPLGARVAGLVRCIDVRRSRYMAPAMRIAFHHDQQRLETLLPDSVRSRLHPKNQTGW